MGTTENLKFTDSPGEDLGDLLLFGASELRALLMPAASLAALEDAYSRFYTSPADNARSLGFQTRDGKFHVKAGLYPGTYKYFAAKVNANFPDNRQRHGLPIIQGLIVLCDGSAGRPLAILQSGALTGRRTAAATALVAKHSARPDASTLAVIGCGDQARHQAQAFAYIMPITRITAFDRDNANSQEFAV